MLSANSVAASCNHCGTGSGRVGSGLRASDCDLAFLVGPSGGSPSEVVGPVVDGGADRFLIDYALRVTSVTKLDPAFVTRFYWCFLTGVCVRANA